MDFYLVTLYVVFCSAIANLWLDDFIAYNLYLSSNSYLWNKIVNTMRASDYEIIKAYEVYKNGVVGYLSLFGLNAMLHAMSHRVLPLTLLLVTLNVVCFFTHVLYSIFMYIHIIQDYTSFHLVHNFIMLGFLNYVYFFYGSDAYFTYFVILSIPYITKYILKLYNYHYDGNNHELKLIDLYLNYF
jgi:hypothetical protein